MQGTGAVVKDRGPPSGRSCSLLDKDDRRYEQQGLLMLLTGHIPSVNVATCPTTSVASPGSSACSRGFARM